MRIIKGLIFDSIKKSVVLETNKSDSNYLSMKNEDFLYLEEVLKRNNRPLYVFIDFYLTNEDKKNKIIHTKNSIEIQKVQKMGVRSYNKKDPLKNTYRIKYFTEVV